MICPRYTLQCQVDETHSRCSSHQQTRRIQRAPLAEVQTQVGMAIVARQQWYRGLYDAFVPFPINPMQFKEL